MEPTRILFVCLGNICRSPLAEAVMRHLVEARGVADEFVIESAGTSAYHVGSPPDQRSTETALMKGVVVEGRSRQLTEEDLPHYDYVIVMDAQNLEDVRELERAAGRVSTRVHRLREWDPEPGDYNVPDPYFGGAQGFVEVDDLVHRSCAALLDHLMEERGRE